MGSLALGLPLYVFPRPFARYAGLAGDDTFIYELGGAAMIGYAVALALGVRNGAWSPIRFVILGAYVFVAIAFVAGFVSFASNQISGLVVIVSLWAVVSAWAVAQILVAHRGAVAGSRDVATWVMVVLALATLSAAVFGLGPQAAGPFAALMGYKGTDDYMYRLAGAACFGYAVMGIQELRSLHWDDMRLPNVMAIVFNGLAFLASAFEILAGRTTLLVVLVALAAGFFTIAIAAIIARRGR
ncbi:MAG: hypothetical protein AUI15_06360 [Actinobacteria bacterium 13_2_20CM_2_66_6]|nr:MAG: hypothetical protein AUI15_06360 [Actinobacteria bacterium 13_2_20CM_2_66_6]